MKLGQLVRHGAFLGWALALLASPSSQLARADAQTQRRAAIVARVLSFERSFRDRVRGSLDFVIVHQDAHEASESCARDWLSGFEVISATKVQERPLTAAMTVYDLAALGRSADAGQLEVLIVCPGLDAEAAELSRLAKARQVFTVGDRAHDVERSFSLAVLLMGDKLQLLINITSAKQEGVLLSSDVLRLAKILR